MESADTPGFYNNFFQRTGRAFKEAFEGGKSVACIHQQGAERGATDYQSSKDPYDLKPMIGKSSKESDYMKRVQDKDRNLDHAFIIGYVAGFLDAYNVHVAAHPDGRAHHLSASGGIDGRSVGRSVRVFERSFGEPPANPYAPAGAPSKFATRKM